MLSSPRFQSTATDNLIAKTIALADSASEHAGEHDHEQDFPEEDMNAVKAAGLLAAPLPEIYGGLGIQHPKKLNLLLSVLKHLGRGNLALARVYEGHVNALILLDSYATAEQLERCSADVHNGCVFGIWNAEDKDRLNIKRTDTTAYSLKGAKNFTSGSGHVTRPIVTANDENDNRVMCLLPMEQITHTVDSHGWQPLGMKSSASYKVYFDNVQVDNKAIIGSANDYLQSSGLIGGAARFCAAQLGAAEALVDITRQHLQSTHRCDSAYQKMRIAKMASGLETGNLWLDGLCKQAQKIETDPEQYTHYVRLMRLTIEQICTDIITLSQQCVGLQGFIKPHPMERIIRDLMTYLRQPAPDAFTDDIASFILTETAPMHRLWEKHNEQ